MVRVRFAPSPTGSLHLGNARIALLNFLYAMKHGGEFILRIDDTDGKRSKPEHVESIQEDLSWMGLRWHRLVFQSQRLDLYGQALAKLKENGRVYECYETESELDFKRKLQRRQGRPPVYDRAALNLTQEEKDELERRGHRPYWRFLLDRDKVVTWTELNGKKMSFQMSSVSDPVLVRDDGVPLYSLPSVVDDQEMGITHIIRGDDHVTNTAVQIQLSEALGFVLPQTLHLALLTDEKGSPLSKRSGDSSVGDLRKKIEPMALNMALAELGNSNPPKPCVGLAALVDRMSFKTLGSSSVRFSFDRLNFLDKWSIRNKTFTCAKSSLGDVLHLSDNAESFWNLIRPNVDSWSHARHWYRIVFADEDVEFNLKECPVDGNLISLIGEQLQANSPWDEFLEGSGKFTKSEVNAGVRWALTGEKHGPNTLSLLGFVTPQVMRRRIATARRILETSNKNL